MSKESSDGAPQFRVGPTSDPDRYVLGAAFTSGAEGILYRGTITTAAGMTLDVAIKMLQPRFLSRVDEWHTRWAEQVEVLRSPQVPGVVPVRDGFLGPLPHPPGRAGEEETLYLVMNWVEGESLDEWIRHRLDRDPIDDLKVLVGVAAALDLMHSGRATGGVPVVHRDIKPANILVTDHGSVLVDFGLTRGLPDGQRLTGVVGTPGYLAPESIDAGSYSPASDRYAFGAVAYFVLTGSEVRPWHQPEAMRDSLVAVPELSELPEVADQVMAMLATDPDERPLGVANWVGQLRRSSIEAGPDILSPTAPRRNPTSPVDRKTSRRVRRVGCRTIALAIGLVIVAAISTSVLVFNILGGPASSVTVAKSSYHFTPIDNPADTTFNRLTGISNSGLIVGYYGNGSSSHPNQGYEVSEPYEGSSFVNIGKPFPSSVQSQVTAINNAGDIAGLSVDSKGNKFLFVDWQSVIGPAYSEPKTPHLTGSVRFLGINDQGWTVGFYKDPSGESHAFKLNQGGNTYIPITVQGASSTVATGINKDGKIVGFTTTSGVTSSFLLLPNGSVYSFQFKGGSDTWAMGINNKDQIVGSYLSHAGLLHGFVLSDPTGPHSVWQSIVDPDGIDSTVVNGINDKGDLVGSYVDSSGNTRGFLAD
jgi:serine/threonine protein kinase